MLFRFFLPTLLSALILSSLVKASSVPVEQDHKDELNPLMMIKAPFSNSGERGRGANEENNFSNEELCRSTESNENNNNSSFAEARGNLGDQEIQEKTYFRLNKDGFWEEGNPKKKQWKLTDRFKESNEVGKSSLKFNISEVLKVFFEHYNRLNVIEKNQAAYAKELVFSSKLAKRIESNYVSELINKSYSYQLQAALHLTSQLTSKLNENTPDEIAAGIRLANQRLPYLLNGVIEISNGPNKIERLLDSTVEFYKEFTNTQATNEKIEGKINTLGGRTPLLTEAQESIQKSLGCYYQLIPTLINFGNLIVPPYEDIRDEKTKKRIQVSSQLIAKLPTSAKKNYFLAKNAFYKNSLEGSSFREKREKYITSIDLLLEYIKDENGIPDLQKDRNKFSLLANECYNQAMDMLDNPTNSTDLNLDRKITYFEQAGFWFFIAAKETKNVRPQEKIISLYLESAEFYKKFGESFDESYPNQQLQQECFDLLVQSLGNLHRERLVPYPKKEVITYLFSSAKRTLETAKDLNSGKNQTGIRKQVGTLYSNIALEYTKNPRNNDKIDSLKLSAKYYLKAANASDTDNKDDFNRDLRAHILSNIGYRYHLIAMEYDKQQQDQDAINQYLNEVKLLLENEKNLSFL
jgi:hypothetical protein